MQTWQSNFGVPVHTGFTCKARPFARQLVIETHKQSDKCTPDCLSLRCCGVSHEGAWLLKREEVLHGVSAISGAAVP